MIGWRTLAGFLCLLNLGLLGWGFMGGADNPAVLDSPGLRAEWVTVEKPWQQAVEVASVAVPAPKINLKEGQAQLDKAIESASQQVAGNPENKQQCLIWGPLLQGESARVQSSLTDWAGRIQRQERPVVIGHVVYLPQEVVSSGVGLKQLSDKGIKDMFYITTPGPMQGTISLGLFRDLERANIQKKELEGRGVSGVQIRERLGPARVFFELRGTPEQMLQVRSAFELNRRGELNPCEP